MCALGKYYVRTNIKNICQIKCNIIKNVYYNNFQYTNTIKAANLFLN